MAVNSKDIQQWKTATCGYCSTGCEIEFGIDSAGEVISARGKESADVNRGKLCLKGQLSFEQLNATGRASEPLLKKDGKFAPVGWRVAMQQAAGRIKTIQAKYGADSFAVVSTGQLFTEEFYTLGKLTRGIIGTNSYDGNTTLCMASSVTGYKRSFGSDGPPACYEDLDHTDCLIAFGSNLPECHPVIYWRLMEALEKKRFPIIVVDPRVTPFAQMADIHIAIRPGTDLAFINALCHLILKDGLQDKEYIEKNCTGFAEFSQSLKKYTPEAASAICGVDAKTIRKVAKIYGGAVSAMSIWTMGINQSTHGSDGVSAINNLSLITGNVGKKGGGCLSITGQCNAMGTREFSSCSGLPGYRLLESKEDREFMAKFWNIDGSILPKKRGMVLTDMFKAIEDGKIKGMWIIATNPVTSMPDANRVIEALKKLDLLIVQDAYEDVETAEYADIFLPASLWAEKQGTFTNTERRVSLTKQIRQPYKNSKPDLWIFNQMAKQLDQTGKVKFPEKASHVFNEMARLSAGRVCDYSGMSHEKLEAEGATQWPSPKDGSSQARLYADGKFHHADGKAKLMPLPYSCQFEQTDEEYPLMLNTGRVVDQFHTRTRTGKIANLNKFTPEPFVEINPATAEKAGIVQMDFVQITSRRASTVARAIVTPRVSPSSVFMPMHFFNSTNRLTKHLVDKYSGQPAYKQCAVRIEKTEKSAAKKLAEKARNY